MAETPDSAAVAVPTREPTAAKLGLWSAGVALGLLLLAAVLFPVTVLLIPVIIVGLVGVIAWMAVREIRSRRGGLERPPIGDAV